MQIDIPTAVTAAEKEVLLRLAAGQRVLEVGALLGYSTVNLASVASHVVSVDPHDGYPAHDPRPTLAPFLANLERYGVRERVTPIIATHDNVFPYLAPFQFGLGFVDCTGEYELTLDILLTGMFLMHPDGHLCVHDCGHPDWPGAIAAVEEFSGRFGFSYEIVDRMAVFNCKEWDIYAP